MDNEEEKCGRMICIENICIQKEAKRRQEGQDRQIINVKKPNSGKEETVVVMVNSKSLILSFILVSGTLPRQK